MKFLKWFLIILVVVAFISVCSEEIGGDKETSTADNATTTENKAEQTQADPQANNPINLGMTPQEMGAGIDKIVKEVAKVDTSLKNVQTDGNIYMSQMGNGVTWYGDVDSTGNAVVSTYSIKFNEKDQGEMLAAIIIAGANARVLSPELPKEQTAGELVKVANEAMEKFNDTLKGSAVTKIVGDYKYIVEVVPEGRLLKVSFVHKDH